MAFKMYGKSPMMKALVGKQVNLPANLKAKIEAAPESPAKFLGGAIKGLKKLGLGGGAMSVAKRAIGKKATASGSKKTKPTSIAPNLGAGMIGKAAGKGQSRPVRKPAKIEAAPEIPMSMYKNSPMDMYGKSVMKKRGCGCKSGACMCGKRK